MSAGLIDTNVLVHAQTRDALGAECLAFLNAVEAGEIQVYLDVLVVHELTYVLPRYRQQMGRADVAAYLLAVLQWPGIVGDKPLLDRAIRRWAQTPRLGFVDAYLAERALRDAVPVYTKNVSEFATLGVNVPDPLPAAGQT